MANLELYLVIYDIANARRLSRVASICKDYGERVQESVFEIHVNDKMLQQLIKRISKVIDPLEDGVKIFPLCESCKKARLSYGAELPSVNLDPLVVI